jgi:aminocarboxymuconate-semialdehyde decarboxylase
MTFVDLHAHAMPMPLLLWLEGRGLADLSAVSDGIVRIDPAVSGVGPGAPLPLAAAQHDVRARLADMDATGVSHQAVSLPPFLLASLAEDADLVAEVVGRGNDALAALCEQDPQRLLPLGSVPVGHPDAAAEARRCLDDLGMRGLAIGTRGMGRELDDPVNEELWALAHDRGALVFLHPSAAPDPHRMRDYWMPQLVGYPAETAIATSRLISGGVRERHPFPLLLAHGGGCLPAIRGRLDLGWERKEVARTTPRPPSAYVRELYVDTAVFDERILAHLIEDFGADHVLVGTDYPFELCDRDPVATVGAQRLPPGDAEAVAWRTAARLLGIEGSVR